MSKYENWHNWFKLNRPSQLTDVVDSLLLYIYTGRINRSNLIGLKSVGEFFDIGDLNKQITSELERGETATRKLNSDCLKVRWKPLLGMRSVSRFSCLRCHFKTSKLVYLHLHLQNDHNHGQCQKQQHRKSVKCVSCWRLFPSRVQFRSHLCGRRRHRQLVECVECGVVFNRDNIIHHLAQIHGVSVTLDGLFGKSKRSGNNASNQTRKSGYECCHCGLVVTTKRDLTTHERLQHEVKCEKKLNFECKICHKRFRRPYLLREHSLVHSKQSGFQCVKCDAIFSSSSNLRRHVKAKHETGFNDEEIKSKKQAQTKFICELCGKVLKSRYSWVSWVRHISFLILRHKFF